MRITVSLIVLFTIVNCVFASDSTDDTNSDYETNFELPKGGILNHILNLLLKLYKLLQPTDEVSFHLYTPLNPTEPQYLQLDDTKSVIESNFNSSLPTRIVIHGWMSDGEQDVNTLIRDAYLSRGPHNIIALDWVAESVNAYSNSVKDVPKVGRKLGKFIDFMAKNGWLKPQNLTIIGHSLGSHVAGTAARSVKSGRVHTVVGLDPAESGFSYETSKHRLRSTDAYYVESIQTAVGTVGYVLPIGKATFYPNGGVIQPGCGADLIKSCAHFRSFVYYAEAIRNGGFPSIPCDSYADAINLSCRHQFSRTVRMGDPRNADVASGIFFVPLYHNPPYSYA